tara:strand:+ start:8 stop:3310 length:3303 start_codon:yes stop_codon:yes gene_type:complete
MNDQLLDGNDALEKIIEKSEFSDNVDIFVSFFYFSGWKLLAKGLKNKNIRILIGDYIDPKQFTPEVRNALQKDPHKDLTPLKPFIYPSSSLEKKKEFAKGFSTLVNETDIYDDYIDEMKIFEDKLLDGSLKIKFIGNDHRKAYLIHYKDEFTRDGLTPGCLISGSSNMTYNGLSGIQGELNTWNEDKDVYEQVKKDFNDSWNNSDNINLDNDFLENVKKDLWIFSNPLPYHLYIRVLHELFMQPEKNQNIKLPNDFDKNILNLKYQTDAVNQALKILDRDNGVILADVVGLGKSIIASTIAHNYSKKDNYKILIVSPPHLVGQWEDYQQQFMLPGAKVISRGVLENFNINNDDKLIIIVDEVHGLKNEETIRYRKLHKLCFSNPKNKVLLLTATPFSNSPADIFALIKLFQVPGASTIQTVDNLGKEFREIVSQDRKLRKQKLPTEELLEELEILSQKIKTIIEPVIIRRSRIDLKIIEKYSRDLSIQNISFPKVIGPEIQEYSLTEDQQNIYYDTLELLLEPEEGKKGFSAARYRPSSYFKNFSEAINKYELDNIVEAQKGLSKIMRRMLIQRFESSTNAFKISLERQIEFHKNIENYWEKLKLIPIWKEGNIPDFEELLEKYDIDETDQYEFKFEEIEKLKQKGATFIDINDLDDNYFRDVIEDRKILEDIRERWFGNKRTLFSDGDPKLEHFLDHITQMIKIDPSKKIIVFSMYVDTTNYIYKKLKDRGFNRTIEYNSNEGKKQRKAIQENFDAGFDENNQKNDYDILITTDALSEGINLHRAGIIINYDIPYNPVKVIQRIGRINRVNKRNFDTIEIYNYFPTETGEKEIGIERITTLKTHMINSILGSDTKTLTPNETLNQFKETVKNNIEGEDSKDESWDSKYINIYEKTKEEFSDILDEAKKIVPRSRIIRKTNKKGFITFRKKNDHSIFMYTDESNPNKVEQLTTREALQILEAKKDEKGFSPDEKSNQRFKIIRDELYRIKELVPFAGNERRKNAVDVLTIIRNEYKSLNEYCGDLIKLIRDFDAINEGDLKEIVSLKNFIEESEESSLVNKLYLILTPDDIQRNLQNITGNNLDTLGTILISEDFRENVY